jgi:urease accessory protein
MKFLTLIIFLLLPAWAFAHPGHDGNGLAAGFYHPFSGWDHCIAMLAVGLWAAMSQRTGQFMVLGGFSAGMALGGLLGMTLIIPAGVEFFVQASTLIAALLVALALRLPVMLQSAVAMLFALLHGIAHGTELPSRLDAAQFGAGFMLATLLLLSAGWLLGRALRTEQRQRGLGMLLVVLTSGFILA